MCFGITNITLTIDNQKNFRLINDYLPRPSLICTCIIHDIITCKFISHQYTDLGFVQWLTTPISHINWEGPDKDIKPLSLKALHVRTFDSVIKFHHCVNL